MALTNSSTVIPSKSFIQTQSSLLLSPKTLRPSVPTKPRSLPSISAVHAAEPAKNPIVPDKTPKQQITPTPTPAPSTTATTTTTRNAVPGAWNVESWKTKKALQLPEYPDQEALESVLETLEAFPPIVFAGEARSLEERLADAAMGNAFLLQGGDCAESFKEFNANNIRDTFRILLQMGVVLMFGGQMPVIKVEFFCCELLGLLSILVNFVSCMNIVVIGFVLLTFCGVLLYRWGEWRVSLRSRDRSRSRRRTV